MPAVDPQRIKTLQVRFPSRVRRECLRWGTDGPDHRRVELKAPDDVEEAPAVGVGREHRLAGRALAGAALVVEDTVAHLMAFPAEA